MAASISSPPIAPAPGPPARQPSSLHIPALDGFRGLALIVILVFHSGQMLTGGFFSERTAARMNDALAMGISALDMFFALSGFLITGILLDTRESQHYFRNFFARRFLRLLPLYYVFLAFLAWALPAIHLAIRSPMKDYQGSWWWYVLHVSNWKPDHGLHDPYMIHIWSLSVEEQFYLAWAFLVFFVPRKYLVRCCLALAAVSVGLRAVFFANGMDWEAIHRLTITRMDGLALGSVMAVLIREGRAKEDLRRLGFRIAACGLAVWLVTGVWGGTFYWRTWQMAAAGSAAVAAAYAGWVLHIAVAPEGWVNRALSSRMLTFLGKRSYAIYIVHILAVLHVARGGIRLAAANGIHLSLPLYAAILVAGNLAAVAIAAVSWKYFESPILRLKDRFADAPPAPAARAAAQTAGAATI